MPAQGRLRASRGVAMVEALVALPVLCLLGLAVLQVALLMHARDGLHHALLEAARAGSLGHASREAIERGLARGLAPLQPASGAVDVDAQRARAAAELRRGLAAGWIRLRKLAPTRESFDDWGEPARDDSGAALDAIEIAVDNLPVEALQRAPASGVAGAQAGAAIGRASGQTLADASLLLVELTYGVPADVPLVGALLAGTLARMNGCAARPPDRLAAIGLDQPQRNGRPQALPCEFYGEAGPAGRVRRARIPIRVVALVRMHTPPRLDADTRARSDAG